jgi:hypothetical protein
MCVGSFRKRTGKMHPNTSLRIVRFGDGSGKSTGEQIPHTLYIYMFRSFMIKITLIIGLGV